MCLYSMSLNGTLSRGSPLEESEDTLECLATAAGSSWREDSDWDLGREDLSLLCLIILIPFCVAVVLPVSPSLTPDVVTVL